MSEYELLKDCLLRLNRAGLSYMVTGSMASNFWGMPRTTHDLDFAIQLPPSAVPNLVQAFAGDYYLDEQAVRAAYRPPHQFNAIPLNSSLKVDFWFPANNPFEREMYRRRVQRPIVGVPAWVATAEDVILHKLYWDKITPSERQRGDVAGVFKVQQGQLDRAYMQHWAAELGVQDKLQQLFDGKLTPKTT